MVFGVFLLHSPAVMTAASHVGDAINSMELDMELVRVDDDDKVRSPAPQWSHGATARHLPQSSARWRACVRACRGCASPD